MSAGSEACVWRIKGQDPNQGGVCLLHLNCLFGVEPLLQRWKTSEGAQAPPPVDVWFQSLPSFPSVL